MRGAWGVAAAVALAIGCGRSGSAVHGSTDQKGGGGDQAGPPCDGVVTVALRGAHEGQLEQFDVDVAAIDAKVGGAAATLLWSASGTVPLLQSGAPALFALNRPKDPIDVTVRLSKVHACQSGACFDAELCTSPITFRLDFDKVVPDGCHAFVQLDLTGSLRNVGAGAPSFLPDFSVKYW